MFKENNNFYPKIKLFKSLLFWHECRFCNMEFRKEKGFKIIDLKKCREMNEDPYYTSYCCCKCANNIEEVKEKIINKNFLSNKPKLNK